MPYQIFPPGAAMNPWSEKGPSRVLSTILPSLDRRCSLYRLEAIDRFPREALQPSWVFEPNLSFLFLNNKQHIVKQRTSLASNQSALGLQSLVGLSVLG